MSLDGSADSIEEVPVIRTAPMVAVVAICMLVYVPLTWSGQRETWMLIADTPPLTLHRVLLIIGTIALWASPMLGLATTLHIAISQRHAPTDRAVMLVLAYLQTLLVTLVVVVHMTLTGVLLLDDVSPTSNHERWLAITVAATSIAACAAIKSISRIAVTSRRLQPSVAVDLPTTRRVSRGAGACGLAAAALSYPSDGTVPTAVTVALFIPVVIIWFATTRPLVTDNAR